MSNVLDYEKQDQVFSHSRNSLGSKFFHQHLIAKSECDERVCIVWLNIEKGSEGFQSCTLHLLL